MSSNEHYTYLIIKIENHNSNKFKISAISEIGNVENIIDDPFKNTYFKVTHEKIDNIIEDSSKPSLFPKKELIKFGKHLFSIIFQNDIKELYVKLKKVSKTTDGLSIKLNIQAEKLINIPWELLYDNGFFALNKKFSISQCNFEELDKPKEIIEKPYPIKILFVAPRPLGVRSVNTGGQLRKIFKNISKEILDGKIQFDVFRGKSLEDLFKQIDENDYDIIHFSSHGQQYFLQLENEKGTIENVGLGRLGVELNDKNIFLLILDACEIVKQSEYESVFNIYESLVNEGISNVIGMRYTVSVKSAIDFTSKLYYEITNEKSIMKAIPLARKNILDNIYDVEELSWIIPTLFENESLYLIFKGGEKPQKRFFSRTTRSVFIGRDKELNDLTDKLLDPKNPILIVHGFAGIGKTALVTQLANEIQYLFRDVLFIHLEEKKITTPERLIETINDFLLEHNLGITKSENEKLSYEGRVKRIVEILSENEFLIILDNFETFYDFDIFDEMKDILKQFEKVEKLKTIVTMRTKEKLTNRDRYKSISSLKKEDSIIKIQEVGKDIEGFENLSTDFLEKIHEKVQGYPTVIELVIPRFESENFEKILKSIPKIVAKYEKFIKKFIKWTYDKLSNEAKLLLRKISVFDGILIFKKLAIKIYEDDKTFDIAFEELKNTNILKFEANIYSILPPIKEFAYNKMNKKEVIETHNKAGELFFEKDFLSPLLSARQFNKAEKYEKILEIAEKYFDTMVQAGLWSDSLELCDLVINISIKIQNTEKENSMKIQKAFMFWRYGRFNEAIEIGEELKSYYFKLNEDKHLSSILNLLGNVYTSVGEWDKAIEQFEKALQKAKKIRDFYIISTSFMNLGVVYFKKGKWDNAIEYYTKSLEISVRENIIDLEAKNYQNIGVVFQRKGKWDNAINYFEKSLKIFNKMSDLQGVANIFENIGQIHFLKNECDKAIEFFYEAIKIYKKMGDLPGIARIHMDIANAFHKKGEIDKAIHFHKLSFKISKEINEPHLIAQSYHNMAFIYHSIKKWNKALECYEKSLEYNERLGDVSGMSLTFNNMGVLYQLKGDWNKALKNYEKSLESKEKIGDFHGMAETYENIGISYGKQKEFENAIKYIQKSITLFEKLGFPKCEKVRNNLVKIRQEIGDEKFNEILKKLDKK